MALDKATLKRGIKTLLLDMMAKTEASEEEFAERLSTMIDAFVKTGTVTIPEGVAVATAGSPTSQTGATTAPGIGTIS